MRYLILILMALLASLAYADSTLISYGDIDDTYLQFANPGTDQRNNGICVKTNIGQHSDSQTVDCRDSPPQNISRSLDYFPLDGIPAGQIIDTAYYWKYLFSVVKYADCSFSDSAHFVVHPIVRKWVEGDSCLDDAQVDDVSWEWSKQGNIRWTTPGAGHIGDDILASAEVETVGVAYDDDEMWVKFPITMFVDSVYSGAITNQGIMTRAYHDQMDDSTQIGLHYFHSTEADTGTTHRPRVEVWHHDEPAGIDRIIMINSD